MRGIGRYILFGDTIDGIYPVNSEAEEPIEPDEPGEPTPPPFPPIPPRPETPPPTPGTPEVPLPPTLTPWERAKEFARRKWRKLAIGTVIVALAIGLSGEDKGNPDAPDKTPTGTEQVDKDFTPPVIEDDRGGEDQEKETPEDPDKEESVFGVESYEMHIDKGHGITHELQEMGKDIFGYTMDSEELMDKYTRYKDVLDPIMGNYFTMMQGEWWGNTGYRYAGEQAEITGEDLDTLLAIIYEGHEAELQDAIEAGDIDINATALEQLKQRLQNR